VTDWDTFFDEHYLRAYLPRLEQVDSAAEGLAAVRLAGCPDGGDVLDCPCGYGRHAVPVAAAGYRVVGADRSEAMLHEARRREQRARWVRADYRELPFDDASFDCVLNLFSSLGYTGEDGDRRALAEFHRVLRPGGALVVETMHRDRLARIYQHRRWEPLAEGAILVEAGRFDPVAGTMEVDHTYVGAGGERHEFTYTLRVYTATEIDRMLREAGFEEVEYHGGLEGGELGWDTRLVAVARA
jgi:ubiquinone/menaquinone biosynthesis C-methylase UbiE